MATIALLLSAALAAPSAAQLFADCSSCDESLTPPVYYGCIGDSAYVAYDDVKVECGAALSLNQTESIPKFYFPDAEEDGLYTLLMMDTLEIDPIVGTKPPFYPHPIIHYGAMNIPGDVLVDGMSMDKFHFDSTQGVRVRPFVSYQKPVPNENLMKLPPSGVRPPALETRSFNYEFILGQQASKKDDPLMDKYTNWEFIGFLKRSIVGNPVASTYISTGYCVKGVEDGLELMDNDCAVPGETGSGLGKVPDRVALGGGGGGNAGSASNPNSGSSGSEAGTIDEAIGSVTGTGGGGASGTGTGGGSSSGGTETGSATGTEESGSSSALANRLGNTALMAFFAFGIIAF